MPDYDFRNLSPIDFEILVRDLIQEELGVRLESFKAGKAVFRFLRLHFFSTDYSVTILGSVTISQGTVILNNIVIW
jgi:hypothetical protein